MVISITIKTLTILPWLCVTNGVQDTKLKPKINDKTTFVPNIFYYFPNNQTRIFLQSQLSRIKCSTVCARTVVKNYYLIVYLEFPVDNIKTRSGSWHYITYHIRMPHSLKDNFIFDTEKRHSLLLLYPTTRSNNCVGNSSSVNQSGRYIVT